MTKCKNVWFTKNCIKGIMGKVNRCDVVSKCYSLLSVCVCVPRLSNPQRVPGVSSSDSVCCLAGGSVWRLWLVSTQAGEFETCKHSHSHPHTLTHTHTHPHTHTHTHTDTHQTHTHIHSHPQKLTHTRIILHYSIMLADEKYKH